MKKRICQIAIAFLTISTLTVSAGAAQISCTSINALLSQILIAQLESCGILPPGWGAATDAEEPPIAVSPPVVPDVPIVQPPVVVEPPVIPNPPVVMPPVTAPPSEPAEGISTYALEVVALVNEIRAEYGLSKLSADVKLCEIARMKSVDMERNNYFAHTSPTYGTPFEMLAAFGVSYRSAGENIAYGYSNPQAVVDAWMDSEGHRENILRASFTKIGVGYHAEGNYWTQLFVG